MYHIDVIIRIKQSWFLFLGQAIFPFQKRMSTISIGHFLMLFFNFPAVKYKNHQERIERIHARVTRRIRKPQLTWMYLSSVASVGLSLMRNFICLKVISEAPPLEPFTVSLWAVTLVDMAVAIICFLLLNFVSIICTGYIEFPDYLKHQLGLAFCRHFNWANF